MTPLLARAAVVAAVIAVAALAGWWWRRRDGRVRGRSAGRRLAPGEMRAAGLQPGTPGVGGLLLGAPVCGSCRVAERVLGEIAAERDTFRFRSVDAADHLELTERLGVMRVPTLLLVDEGGRVVGRSSGVPARDELLAVIDDHAPAGVG